MVSLSTHEEPERPAAERGQRTLAEALRDTAAALNSTLDFDELMDCILDNVGCVLPHDAASMMLVEGDVARITNFRSAVGCNPAESVVGTSLLIPNTQDLSEMIRTGQPIVIPDTQSYVGWNPQPQTLWIRSHIGAPISVKDKVIGFLNLDSAQPNFYGPAQIEELSAFADQAAVALENARLLAEAKRRADEFAALYNTMQELATNRDLSTLLQTIVDRASALLKSHSGFIYLCDAAREDLELAVVKDMFLPLGSRLSFGEGMAGRVALRREPLIVDNYAAWEGRSPQHSQSPYRAAVEVPMLFGGDLIGVLGVSEVGESTRTFSEADARLLSLFASQAASAVHEARLFAALERRVAELNVLQEVALDLTSQLQLQPLLETILRRATELLHSTGGVIYQWEESTHRLRCTASYHLSRDYTNVTLRPGEGMAGRVYQTGKPLVVNDYARWEGHATGLETIPSRAVISVPVRLKERIIGTLNINDESGTQKFDDQDVWLLSLFANQVAIGLENARLYAELEQELGERRLAEEALKESEERYALAVSGANDGLWDWNLKTNVVYYSPRWKSIFGCIGDEVGDSPDEWFKRVHPDDIDRLKADLAAHLEGRTPHFESEHRVQHWDGSYVWVHSRGLAVRKKDGTPYRIAGSLSDITTRKSAEQQLVHDAFQDALTDLPNRALFMDRLGRAVERAKRNKEYRFAILYLDLDRFKLVNDSLGHSIGDQLLIESARRMETCVRNVDTVARFGGDEFVILLDEIKDVNDATHVAERIQSDLASNFNLGGHQVFNTASIGIVLSTHDYDRPEDILRDADIAMYRAKSLGKARYEVFDATMRELAMARMDLETDLRGAIERQEFRIHYQPIVSLENDRIIGFEALLRWQHPRRGLVPPAMFIPAAEETGLIVPLGKWVLTEACRQMCEWHEQYPTDPPLAISVNFSVKQFVQPDVVEQVKQTLEETGIQPDCVRLEVTESLLMEDTRSVTDMLMQLRALGVQVQIDDFGTGYSSLSYLHEFPIDTLKIDRSFVNKMGVKSNGNGSGSEIVRTIVTLARELGMRVVAEGVETKEQFNRLKSMKCEFGQGYFISRPLVREDAVALIAKLHQHSSDNVESILFSG